MTNAAQQFEHVDVLRLEVQKPATGLTNLVVNPDGVLGGWGWVTPVPGSAMSGTGTALEYVSPTPSAASHVYTEPMRIAAGQYAGARWNVSAITGYYRARFQWLDSALVVLSSGTQTAYTNTTGDLSIPATVAPAGAAFMRLRFDLYSNTGAGNPVAGATIRLRRVVAASAFTAAALGVTRTNLFPNPSFEINTVGWPAPDPTVTSIARTGGGSQGSYSLRATAGTGHPHIRGILFGTDNNAIMVERGQDYTVTFASKAVTVTARSVQTRVYWYGFEDEFIGRSIAAGGFNAFGAWTTYAAVVTAPGNAQYCRVDVEVPLAAPGEQHLFDGFMFEKGFDFNRPFITGTLTAQFLGVIDYGYQNIIGPTHKIKTNREELNLGTLVATILDTSLDPATADLIRPGRRCRLMALDNTTGLWDAIYTGKLAKADVTYDPLHPAASKVSRIFLTATDATAPLANATRPDGVGTIAELPAVLEGAGVPWNVNGNGNQVASATVVSNNANASALDQVAITRDSRSGYAWVDRKSVLRAYDPDKMPVPTGPGLTTQPRTNLCVNPSFETNITSWSAGGSVPPTVTRSTTRAHSGVASLRAVWGTGGTLPLVQGPTFATTIGQDYTLSGWAWVPNGSPDVFLAVPGKPLTGTTATLRNQWVRVSMTFTATAASHSVQVWPAYGATAGQEVYLDNFLIEAGTALTPAFNGATPNTKLVVYAWTGTAHASTSTATATGYVVDDTDYNTNLDVSFSTAGVINEATIINIEWDPADPTKSIEVTYGPYRDDASIDEWGRYASTFKTHGLSAAQVAALGATILAKNATPTVQINSVQVPITQLAHIGIDKALLDLYSPVLVSNSANGIDQLSYVTGIEHEITSDGWLMTLTFTDAVGVAAPQITPPVQSTGTTAPLTGGALNLVGPWATAAPPNGTTGTALTIDVPGRYLFDVQMSGFVATVGLWAFYFYLNGVEMSGKGHYFNAASDHRTGPRMVVAVDLSPGTHYLYARFTGSSDNNDSGAATWLKIN